MTTSVVWHPACRLHQAGAGHPERPERIATVLEALRAPDLTSLLTWSEAAPADRAALERVHPAAYLDGLAALAGRGGGALDPDTYLGARSWEAALASAGVAISAVDAALLPLGVEKESRAYSPHLTLARSGSGRPQHAAGDTSNRQFARLQEKLAARPAPDFGTMTAREFFLYQSKLMRGGAVYSKLTRFELH